MRPPEFSEARLVRLPVRTDQKKPMVTAPTNRNASPVAKYPTFIASIFGLHSSWVEEKFQAERRPFASRIMAALQQALQGM